MAVELVPLPPADAIRALERRGRRLDPSFSWQDVWEAEHAAMFTVAKSAGFDILADIHAALERALKEGRTFRDFSKELTPVLQAKGWWGRQLVRDPATGELAPAQLGSARRLRTIFDANMRVSYATGHWASFERNKAVRPYLRYVAILDERTRPAHRARHNLVLPVDHPYWERWAPPCGWNCRCTLQSLSQRDVDRLQRAGEELRFQPPEDTFRTFVNRRTGEVSRVPDGIDPGWAYNPGKAGHQAAALLDRLIDAPADMANAFGAGGIARALEPEFADWIRRIAAGQAVKRSTYVAGVLSKSVIAGLRARDVEPASGAITVTQGRVGHALRDLKKARGRAVPEDVLARLPALLANPRAILLDRRDKALLYVFDLPGREEAVGKLLVRVNFSEKVREKGERPRRIVANSFRTAGIVDRSDLAAPVYEVLEGAL